MKKSIFLKMFGSYIVIILVLSILIPLFSYSRIRAHHEESLIQELLALGRILNADILPFVLRGKSGALDEFVKARGKDIQVRITVIDPEGRVLGDSNADPAKMENHRYRPEVSQAFEGQIGHSSRFSYTVEQQMLYVGLPLESEGRMVGVTRLSLFMRDVEILMRGLRAAIFGTAILGALGALGLALAVSLHFVRPIRRLTQAAQQMTEDRFRTRVAIRHNDEFRDLGEAFNAMAARIQKLFAELSGRKDEIDHIIASLQEGLMVVSREGRIVLANSRLKGIIGEPQPEGKFVWEIIRKPKLLEFIGGMMSSDEPKSLTLQIDERHFICTAAGLSEQGGFVLTLHEVGPVT